MPRLFCFGLGFTGQALAAALRAEGWALAGTVRDPARAAALTAGGLEAWPFDRDHPLEDPAAALAGTTHLLASAPPDGVAAPSGDPVLDRHGADIAALMPGLAWAGYLSTTGVYGDRGGGTVDEDSALDPSGERGRRRVAAERAWLDLWRDRGVPVHLFRLSGIYGPGRSALDQVRRGTAKRIDKPGQIFNRIHVEDIVAVLRASIARPNPGAAYNVADDDPAPSPDVIAHACALLGVDPPPLVPFAEADLSPMARSFYADSKRVSNARLKAELGVTLKYPSYRDGLAAQRAAEREGP
jgi:nucleoside-diphosphate-sugar epimerase